ncbi:universal stress protein [Psychrobium sp. 1_MG-2023]|uniref:universal stress protein n=1 Tax=Psychrobium sp. 1_MG-2023 TaxID=3062624 RepID=UPI000C341D7B|nr:universal stress protein [Psychrobium sp. 1_MG-2023]MDP2559662.1 universal stress protein [Psychrobium sp. 1_MG-2023]PKF59493.1 universal stress protein [Alteromonadales bacterium alter-6D02]
MSKQTYVVGVDGSEWSERAVSRAINLAQQTQAQVNLVYIIDWSGHESLTLEEMAHRDEDKQAQLAKIQADVLDSLTSEYQDSGVDITTNILWGKPAIMLHEHSKKSRANMIFVGRRGRSVIANLITGSTADKLVHIVGLPIVLVP